MRRPDRDPDVQVVVYGKPATKGSTRSFIPRRKDGSLVTREDGEPMVVTKDDSKDGKAWAGDVSRAAAEVMQQTGLELVRVAPLWVEAVFVRPRPRSHFGAGRNATVLRGSAPAYPAVRPDVDKQARAILDALKGVLWADDGQVVALPAFQVFGDPARCELRAWVLPATVSEQPAQTGTSPLFG